MGSNPLNTFKLLTSNLFPDTMIAFLLTLLVVAAAAEICQVPGGSICKSVDLPDHQSHPCCAGSDCLPWTGKGSVANADPDYFCQYVEPIPVGGDCSGMRGTCVQNSACVEGVCVEEEAERKWFLF